VEESSDLEYDDVAITNRMDDPPTRNVRGDSESRDNASARRKARIASRLRKSSPGTRSGIVTAGAAGFVAVK
jgi:hypothetical protein